MLNIVKILASLLFLSSCADLGIPYPQQRTQGAGTGFAAGVATQKTIDKVKEVLTPVYKSDSLPQKLCYRLEKTSVNTEWLIECVVAPCVFEEEDSSKCKFVETESEYWAREKVSESLDTSNLRFTQIREKCAREPEECNYYLGLFKDKTVLLVKDNN